MNRLIYLAAFALVSCGDGFYDIDDMNLNVDLVVDQVDGSQAEPEYSDYRLIFSDEELQLRYGKKGFGGASEEKALLTKCCWAYNWGTGNTMNMPINYEFIAMQWSSSGVIADTTIDGYKANVESGDVERILGFNEPDSSNQSNMSVATAINAWPQLQNLRIPLASPAVTDNAEGTAWMNEFMAEFMANDYRVDYIAVHCYSCATSLSSLKSNLQKDVYVYYKDEDGETTIVDIVEEYAISGDYSVVLSDAGSIYQRVEVEAGVTYCYGMTARIQDTEGVAGTPLSSDYTASIYISQSIGSGYYLSALTTEATTSLNTLLYDGKVTIPTGVDAIYVEVVSSGGVAYVDGVYLREDSSVAKVVEDNYIYNPLLEIGLWGWMADSTTTLEPIADGVKLSGEISTLVQLVEGECYEFGFTNDGGSIVEMSILSGGVKSNIYASSDSKQLMIASASDCAVMTLAASGETELTDYYVEKSSEESPAKSGYLYNAGFDDYSDFPLFGWCVAGGEAVTDNDEICLKGSSSATTLTQSIAVTAGQLYKFGFTGRLSVASAGTLSANILSSDGETTLLSIPSYLSAKSTTDEDIALTYEIPSDVGTILLQIEKSAGTSFDAYVDDVIFEETDSEIDSSFQIPTDTIIKNGDFEDGTYDNWTISGTAGSTYWVAGSDYSVSGDYSICLYTGSNQTMTQTVEVESGATYELGMSGRMHSYVGTDDSAGENPGTSGTVTMSIASSGGVSISTNCSQFTYLDTYDNIVSDSVVIPSGVTSINVAITKSNAKAYVDDVWMVKTADGSGETGGETTDPDPTPVVTNLLSNGDGEDTTSNAWELVVFSGTLSSGVIGDYLTYDTANPISGESSMLISGTPDAIVSMRQKIEPGVLTVGKTYEVGMTGRIQTEAGAGNTGATIANNIHIKTRTYDDSGLYKAFNAAGQKIQSCKYLGLLQR